MQQILIVGVGGFVGAVTRYAVNGAVQRRFPPGTLALPLATLVVNVAGCFAIGVLMALVAEKHLLSRNAQLLLATGFLGSLTTFSAFGYETVELLRGHEIRFAAWNVGTNLVLGLAAVWLGRAVVHAVC